MNLCRDDRNDLTVLSTFIQIRSIIRGQGKVPNKAQQRIGTHAVVQYKLMLKYFIVLKSKF